MEEKITLCGDNCQYCPRYTAKSEGDLEKVAELWHRVGWRDKIVTNDEIKCLGCSSHKQCTYGRAECIKEQGIEKCSLCPLYPCEKIADMLKRTEEYKTRCKINCTEEEYALLTKAFFEKEQNLHLNRQR